MQNNDLNAQRSNENTELNVIQSGEATTTFSYTDSICAPKTPVLFSTNGGIYLRSHNPISNNDESNGGEPLIGTIINTSNNIRYNVQFCDLERWQSYAISGKQMNSIGLTPDTNLSNSSTNNGNVKSKSKMVRFVAEYPSSSPSDFSSMDK